MAVIIKGGTVVTADDTYRADVLCIGETIAAIGENLDVPAGAEVIDAGGAFGYRGHRPPYADFLGTVDEIFAGLPRRDDGTTMCIDHSVPATAHRGCLPMAWLGRKGLRYSFHVAIWWTDSQADMTTLSQEYVNSFKHFWRVRTPSCDDEVLVNSFTRPRPRRALHGPRKR